MFCPRQAVFSVTRNRFRNRKQLARKGVENSSEVVVFYRALRVQRPNSRQPADSRQLHSRPVRNLIRQHSKTGLNKHKKGGRFCRIIPSNRPHSARFSAEKSSQTGTISERSETFFNPGSLQSEFEFRQKRQRFWVQKRPIPR